MASSNRRVSCRSCNAPAPFLLSTRDFNRRISAQSFSYYRCGACGLVFLHPIPSDLSRYYEEQYHSIPDSLQALEQSAAAHEAYKIELLQSLKPCGRVIEIGPGTGGFAWLAKRAGFDVTAIEISARACAFISRTVGVRVVHTSDEIGSLEVEDPADAIVMWQVLEHLPDPFRILQASAKALRPGGVLIVATPNPDSLQFRLFGKWWTHLDAPRHVTLIPARLLQTISVSLGLQHLWTTTTDRGSLFWNRFGWEYSLRNVTRHKLSTRRIELIATRVSRLTDGIEKRVLRGSAYTAAFRAPQA